MQDVILAEPTIHQPTDTCHQESNAVYYCDEQEHPGAERPWFPSQDIRPYTHTMK